MALIEIEESELAAHRRLTETMNALLTDPRTRTTLLKAQKTLNPLLAIPELDAAEPLRGEISDVAKQVAALQASLEADRAERAKEASMAPVRARWDAGRKLLREQGYTDEGMETVEKFMEAKGIADHEIAAAAYERLHPPVEPVRGAGGTRFDLFDATDRGSDAMKALLVNPDDEMALGNLVNDTLRQVRGR